MSGRCFVITTWLMYVCVAAGCASGPSRNFFSRRAKPTTSEDEFVSRLMTDAKRLDKNGDREGANHLRDQANAVADSASTGDGSTHLAEQDQSRLPKTLNSSTAKGQANLARTEASSSSKRRPLELPDDVASQLTDDVAQTKSSSTRSPFSLNDDSSATARLQLDGDADDFTKTLRESPQKRSGGGQFGVSGRTSIEAPAPKRRSGALQDSVDATTPSPFQAPPNARELMPQTPTGDGATEFSQEFSVPVTSSYDSVDRTGTNRFGDTNSNIVSADYQTTDSISSGVVQTGASRQSENDVRDTTNPWDQYRGLTKPLDPPSDAFRLSESRQGVPRDFRSSPTASRERDRSLATDPDLSMRSETVQWPSNVSSQFAPNNSNPQPWPAHPQNVRSSAPQYNGATSPELWPRAPGANGFAQSNDNAISNAQGWTDTPSVGVPSATSNIQPTNGEQPSFSTSVIPGFNYSPQQAPTAGPLAVQALANEAVLFPLPNGAPSSIAPFVSSPDLDRLIVQTASEAAAMIPGENEAERQAYLRKHVQLRLLHLIAGQMDRALQPVPSVDPADQEFWQQMLWGVANYFDVQGMPDSAERATQTISQLKSATMRLQEKARLELHNVAFCHKITSFGSYQRFKRDEFTPGQPVLLYAEVTNFKSEPTSDGQFRTLMKSSVEVFEGGIHGRMIESIPFAPSEDRCRNHRRDYFHSYEFAIPQGISSGPHVLRLTVEDQLGKKSTVTTLNFTVQ